MRVLLTGAALCLRAGRSMTEGSAPFKELALTLVVLGLLLVAGGLVLLFFDKLPGLGKLPGDIVIRRERWTLYFPVTTLILISLLLTLLLNLLRRR